MIGQAQVGVRCQRVQMENDLSSMESCGLQAVTKPKAAFAHEFGSEKEKSISARFSFIGNFSRARWLAVKEASKVT